MILTKQEILQQKDAEFWESEMKDMEVFDQNYPESVCLNAMQEFSNQENNKQIFDFFEWFTKNITLDSGEYCFVFYFGGLVKHFEDIRYVYDFWSENIMNTQQKEIEQ